MKNFSVFMAFIFAVMISSTAFAADWVQVDAGEGNEVYVDKSSIKRGIESNYYKISRKDGFSAVVKIKLKFGDNETDTLTHLIGFFEENGAKKYYFLEGFDENGNLEAQQLSAVEAGNADGSDGAIWPYVYDYVQKNLP